MVTIVVMQRRVGGEAVPGQPLGEDANPVGETGPVPQQHPVGVRLVRHVPLRRSPGAGPTGGEGRGETEVAGVITKYYQQEQQKECVNLMILVKKIKKMHHSTQFGIIRSLGSPSRSICHYQGLSQHPGGRREGLDPRLLTGDPPAGGLAGLSQCLGQLRRGL